MAIIRQAFKRASFAILHAMDFVEGFLIDERASGEERLENIRASPVRDGIFHENDGKRSRAGQ